MADLIILLLLVWCLWLTLSRRKKAKVYGADNSRSLTRSEKIQIWIICLMQPVWGGAILYYGWRKPLPVMAKEANRILFTAFGIELGLFIIGLTLYLWLASKF